MSDINKLIFGKDPTDRIVNISVKGDKAHIFREFADRVEEVIIPFKQWVLSHIYDEGCTRLKGKEHYKYMKRYDTIEDYNAIKSNIYKHKLYSVLHKPESLMLIDGYTYFKGMKVDEVSILSFDIETNGLSPHKSDSTVYLITNAFRKNALMVRKSFIVDEYETPQDMIRDWCNWVMEMDPSVITGYNIVAFDIPYLQGILKKTSESLVLGRDGSEIEVETRPREKRKDGSQSYTYHRINIFGREVIDMFFVAIDYDIGRKYESYQLKAIVKHEGLDKADRQYYDATKIKDNWNIPEEKAKIIQYGEDDADDPIKLFDLMIPAKFYLTPHIPKPFQIMTESASGSQLNAFMVRSYLQDGFSVARPYEAIPFEGAISFGNPGIYHNVFKVDVASLYPSIMLTHKISPGSKDFNNNFLTTLEYFTDERLANKKRAKDTGDRYYKDLEQSQKIVINSAYGFMGANGLNYNNPAGAAEVTKHGRDVINTALTWANTKEFVVANADTDSISFTTGTILSSDDKLTILKDLNSLYPTTIHFEDDGYYQCLLVLKAKNYVLYDGEKMKLKGSSIRDQKKEKALSEMLLEMLKDIIHNSSSTLSDIYLKYIKEAKSPVDIKRWAQKKTVTKVVLNCMDSDKPRKNETDVLDAIKGKPVQEGDKIYLYPVVLSREVTTKTFKNGKTKEKITQTTGLRLVEDWNNDHNSSKLVDRVKDTTEILSNVVDKSLFIDYTKKENEELLEKL